MCSTMIYVCTHVIIHSIQSIDGLNFLSKFSLRATHLISWKFTIPTEKTHLICLVPPSLFATTMHETTEDGTKRKQENG